MGHDYLEPSAWLAYPRHPFLSALCSVALIAVSLMSTEVGNSMGGNWFHVLNSIIDPKSKSSSIIFLPWTYICWMASTSWTDSYVLTGRGRSDRCCRCVAGVAAEYEKSARDIQSSRCLQFL